ncbi:MAG: LapA family protein [Gammaproteobacteria bacterium]|nr:LapA family protein [Gammaproteobacteria bacterium]MYD81679.1 LapA family protein [Gammaproteobacteria bacterium]
MQFLGSCDALKIVKRVGLIALIAFGVIFCVVLVIENRAPTVVSLWLVESPDLPLVIWLVVCFVLGLLVGTFTSFFLNLRRHKGSSTEPDPSSSSTN